MGKPVSILLAMASGLLLPGSIALAQVIPDQGSFASADPALPQANAPSSPPQPNVAEFAPAVLAIEKVQSLRIEPEAVALAELPAPAPDMRAAVPPAAIFVGAISFTGLHDLAPADFADIIARFVGRELAPADLASLADAIADRLRQRDFAFAAATIKPQRLSNAVLAISVDEGVIDEVRLQGIDHAAARRVLAPLVNGRPVRASELERRLLLAGDTGGIRVRKASFRREAGRGILDVQVSQDRATLNAVIANQGTRTIGPVQARIEADLYGLIDQQDHVTLTYSTTPVNPNALQFGRLRYARRIDASGTELALSGTLLASNPGSYLEPLDLHTQSWAIGLSMNHPILRRRAASFWIEGELGLRNLRQFRAGVLLWHDQIAAARLSLRGNAAVAGGRWRVNATVSQGLGILGATRPGDPLAARRDADGTFTSANIWTDWIGDLGQGLSLRLAAQAQITDQPLPLSEEMTIGGAVFLRGYDWGERSGDEGAAGLVELRYLIEHPFGLGQRMQIYGFADGGTVSNLAAGYGGGTLASAGGGLRMDLTNRLGATLEVAVPLSGPRYDSGQAHPKLNLAVMRNF